MDHKSVHSAGYSSQAQMQNRDNVIHQGVGISLPYCTAVEETADKISLLHRYQAVAGIIPALLSNASQI